MMNQLFGDSSRRSIPFNWLWAIPFVVLSTFVAKGELIFAPVESDSGLFAYTGMLVLDGALLFRDTPFAFRPPGIYLINALALWLFGHSSLAIHIAHVIWTSFMALALALLLRKFCRPSVLYAVMFLFVVLFSIGALGTGNTGDNYLGLPIIIGLYLLIRGQSSSPTGRTSLLVGLMIGLALIFKQPAVFVAITLWPVLLWFWKADGLTRLSIVRRSALFISGVMIPITLLSLYAVMMGVFKDMVFEILLFPLDAISSGRNPISKLSVFSFAGIILGYFLLPATFWCCVIGLGWLRRRLEFTRTHALLISWLAGSLIGVFAHGMPAARYYLPAVPAICAIAGLAMEWCMGSKGPLAKYPSRVRRNVVLILFGLLLAPRVSRDLNEFSAHFLFPQEEANTPTVMESLASFIGERTDPNDYIYGYGSHKYAAVAFVTQRRFATRHVSPKIFDGRGYENQNFPPPERTVWMLEEWQNQIIETEPKFIFALKDSVLADPRLSDLASWVSEHYQDVDLEDLPSGFSGGEEPYQNALPVRVRITNQGDR